MWQGIKFLLERDCCCCRKLKTQRKDGETCLDKRKGTKHVLNSFVGMNIEWFFHLLDFK